MRHPTFRHSVKTTAERGAEQIGNAGTLLRYVFLHKLYHFSFV